MITLCQPASVSKSRLYKQITMSGRKLVTLTHEQKRAVCLHKQKNPSLTNRDLVTWVLGEYKCKVHEATVSRLLKKSYALTNVITGSSMKRLRDPYCPAVEEALHRWFLAAMEAKLSISDDILTEKAKQLHAHLLITNPGQKDCKFSSGWSTGFKKRYSIKFRVLHGEANSVEVTEDVLNQMEALKAKCSMYEKRDIYNMDETGLFFKLQPNKTLSDRVIAGQTKDKTRITVGLCSNADGSVKLPPMIINHFKNPRCFSSRRIKLPNNLGITWYANKTAWMNQHVFQDWVRRFEEIQANLGRSKVILIVDNCPGHLLGPLKKELKITTVLFLPANTTARFQPMDAGIIQSFKVYYRKLFVKRQLAAFESQVPFSINVYDSIQMILPAWYDGVKLSTIVNCWRHTGFTAFTDTRPRRMERDIDLEATVDDPALEEQIENLGEYMRQLSVQYPVNLTVHEYLAIDNVQNAPTFCTNPDISEWLIPDGARQSTEEGEVLDEEPELEDGAEEEVVPSITYGVAQGYFETIKVFLQQQSYDTSGLLTDLTKMMKLVTKNHTQHLVQSNLDEFFQLSSTRAEGDVADV